MSVEAMNAAWSVERPLAEKLVLLGLAWRAGRDTHKAWPSAATLSQMTGYTERHVRRQLRELEAAGLIENVEQSKWNKPTTYYLKVVDRGERTPVSADIPLTYLLEEYREDLLRIRSSRASLSADMGVRRGALNSYEAGTERPSLPEVLALRWSYILADGLIERGHKKKRWRDDARSEEWTNQMYKLLLLIDGQTKPADVEAVVRYSIDFLDWTFVSPGSPPPKLVVQQYDKIVEAMRQEQAAAQSSAEESKVRIPPAVAAVLNEES